MMAYTNFIPEIWSKQILKTFRQNSVMGSLVNRDYEGEISKAGDVVYIRSFGSVTVRDYTRGTAITYETLTDPMQSLLIDQQKYFAFRIDDLDKAQTDLDIAEGYAKQAALAVRDVVDLQLYNHYTSIQAAHVIGGTTSVAVTKTNIYDYLTQLAELLDVDNIPQEDRALVVSPKFKRVLLQSDAFTRATSLGDDAIQNGFIGQVAGFKVHVSTVVPVLTGGIHPIMAMHRDFVTMASQVSQVEHIRPTDMFAHAVRGLYLYGSKVVRPEAGALLRCTLP
jgi:N4-gp56 family major capsid protein